MILFIILLIGSLPFLVAVVAPEYPNAFLPSLTATGLLVATAFIAGYIRTGAARVLVYCWLIWYVVGSMNTVASSLFLGGYYSNNSLRGADFVYGVFCVSLAFVCLLLERVLVFRGELQSRLYVPRASKVMGAASLLASDASTRFGSPVSLLSAVILLFPAAWLVSMLLVVGNFPILSGVDITETIYETYYGPLYPYVTFYIVALLLATYKYLYVNRSSYLMVYILVFLLLSFVDGKRIVAMVYCAGALAMAFTRFSGIGLAGIMKFFVPALLLYVAIAAVRAGGDSGRVSQDSIAAYMLVGVEYRDFVYSFLVFEPGGVPGYSFIDSSLGAFFNEGLLSLFGFDKSELVNSGSAYVWARLYNSPYGIRTGLVSELYFAYGWLGLWGVPVFAVLLYGSNQWLGVAAAGSDGLAAAIAACFIGLLFMAIVGQSTVTFGMGSLLFYLWVLSRIVKVLERLGPNNSVNCSNNS